MSKISRCVFCGSAAFGPGCPFSDHKKHFHAGDPKRCCWCGSSSFGPGCPFNPFGTNHVHGVQYNQMVKDSVSTGIIGGYILEKLSQPIEEMVAYKLGLIDKSGKKIKEPQTAEEHRALGIVEQYVLMLRNTLGSKLDLLNSTALIKLEENVSMDDYEKLCDSKLNLGDDLKRIVNEFKETVTKAYGNGLSTAAIEKIIVESILKQ